MSDVKVSQVKGSMLVGFIKAIKADSSGRFDGLLSDEAKALLDERVLAAKWYPFDAYKSCFQAVCKVNAASNPEVMRQFGKQAGEETMKSIYRTVFDKTDAAGVMDSFRVIGSTVYDSVRLESEALSDNRMRLSFHDFDPDFPEWYLVGLGWMQRTLELVLGKDVNAEVVEKSWEGAPATVFEMSW